LNIFLEFLLWHYYLFQAFDSTDKNIEEEIDVGNVGNEFKSRGKWRGNARME
jgi:hypothetical protein